MPVTHNPGNINQTIDWSEMINDIDNQFGFIRSMNNFKINTTTKTSIIFDKKSNSIRIIPESNRNARDRNVGKDDVVEQFAMILQHYPYDDAINNGDIQDQRRPGADDLEETLTSVRLDKLMNLRMAQDQTDEKLRLAAMKGDLPPGAVAGVSDMYDLFGLDKVNDFTVDLDLDNQMVDLDAKISEVKRKVAAGFKSGSAMSGVDWFIDEGMFDLLMANPKFREVWNQYVNSGRQRLRDENMDFYSWGVVDVVEHRGVRIMAYNPEFEKADSTLVKVFDDNAGIAMPRTNRNLLRGYWGPATPLMHANSTGMEMFAQEYTTQDGRQHIIETEATKLYFNEKPASTIQLITTPP